VYYAGNRNQIIYRYFITKKSKTKVKPQVRILVGKCRVQYTLMPLYKCIKSGYDTRKVIIMDMHED